MNVRVVILTEKLKKFIELEEEKGTIRYRKPRRDPEKEKGSRFLIAPNFAYPACYDERPMSADGRVAFHFKHTFVVKRLVSAADGGGQGRETRLVVTGDKDASRAVKVKGQSASAAGYEAYISNPQAELERDSSIRGATCLSRLMVEQDHGRRRQVAPGNRRRAE